MSRTNDDPRGERMESPEAERQRLMEERDAAIAKEEAKARDLSAADLLLNQYVEERDAAIRERDEARADRAEALRARDVQHDLRLGFEERVAKQAARVEKAEALLRDIAHRFGAVQLGVETMAKIREALTKP